MSEENTEVEAGTVETEETNETLETPEVEAEKVETEEKEEESDDSSEVAKWRSFSRSWEAKAKESAEKLKQVEEQLLSYKDKEAEFASRLAELESENLKNLKVAALTGAGLNTDLSSLISGTNKEEVDAQVELLKSNLAQTNKGVPFTPVKEKTEETRLSDLFNRALSDK